MNERGYDTLRKEIFKIVERLTSTMDQMKQELMFNGNSLIKYAVRALASAQGQLLKAYFSLDPSNRIPPAAGETFQHFLAKNSLAQKLLLNDVCYEVGIGDCVVDVVGRIGDEYVILEAETIPTNCVQKVEKIKNELVKVLSGKISILNENENSILKGIKRQIITGKPIRLIFAVTRMPNKSTLNNIKKAENYLIHPEVYYVNKQPPFKISSNLLHEF
jgi:hypothetical protein